MVFARRVTDLLFSSVRLGVGRPMILAAVFVMRVSLAWWVTESVLKKHVEQYFKLWIYSHSESRVISKKLYLIQNQVII